MKRTKLILSFFTLTLTLTLSAGEMTGAGARALLVKNGIDAAQLERSGAKILAGELTGAGKTLDIEKIKFFMTKKEVFDMQEVRHVQLTPSAERVQREGRLDKTTLNDINFLEVNSKKVRHAQIEALVVQ